MTDPIPTDPPRESLFQRILQFPLTRLIVALAFVALGGVVGSIVRDVVATAFSLERGSAGRGLLSIIVLIPFVTFAYWAYVLLIERRPLSELSLREAVPELGTGALIGGGLFALVIGAIAACGGYRILGVNPILTAVPMLTASVLSGYIEELVGRGIVFRIVEEGLGTWTALTISAALFGLLHLGNPNATWISSAAIALTAGVLLGAVYVITRRLWLAIGLHFAWNFIQGGLFGVAVSGHEAEGILRSELTGPDWIAGGAFGAEASIFAVVFCIPVAVYFLVLSHRRGLFLPPMWRRDRTPKAKSN